MADDFIAEDRGEATERFIDWAMQPYSYLGGPIACRGVYPAREGSGSPLRAASSRAARRS